jgi:hypothetical protein
LYAFDGVTAVPAGTYSFLLDVDIDDIRVLVQYDLVRRIQ